MESKMDIDSTDGELYLLSSALTGHGYGVRDIALSDDQQLLLTLEERGRLHVWEKVCGDNREWIRRSMFDDRLHDGLSFVIESIEGCRQGMESVYGAHCFMTGGGDKIAVAINADSGKILHKLTGHANVVHSISRLSTGYLVTGSWDGVARVWCDGDIIARYDSDKKGVALHEHSCEVLGLCDGYLVTASSNKSIHIFKNDQLIKTVKNAHDHAIRKLIPHPKGFLSIGNDGIINIWALDGSCISHFSSHSQADVKFLYGAALINGGSEIVVCGEDSTVRIIDGTSGSLIQAIAHPGPVRSVKVMKNGDIVTGCTDKVCRIFTRSKERIAPQKQLEEFEELIRLTQAGGKMKQIDPSTLPDESVLQTPGKKDKDFVVVNVKGRSAPVVYQWMANQQQWIEIGEALGENPTGSGAPSSSSSSGSSSSGGNHQLIDGVDYEFVTDVFVTDNQKVKLGFNRDDDPEDVAERFIRLYSLPDFVRQQIIDHCTPMVDPIMVAEKKARLKREADAALLLHTPSWSKGGGFHMWGQANISAMKKKMPEVNKKLQEEKNDAALNDKELSVLIDLIDVINNPTHFHVVELSDPAIAVIRKLVKWPVEQSLPIMDFIRMIFLISNAAAALSADDALLTALLSMAKSGNDTHLSLLLKGASNMLAKRPRSKEEKSNPPTVPAVMAKFLVELLTISEEKKAATSDHDNLHSAWIMFIHNIVVWLGRTNISQSDFYTIITKQLIALHTNKMKQRTLYYCLLSIASIAIVCPSIRSSLLSSHRIIIEGFVKEGLSTDNAALKEVAGDAAKVYSLK